jgi:pimeloyl-ACP methyl ester carboxylesterase
MWRLGLVCSMLLTFACAPMAAAEPATVVPPPAWGGCGQWVGTANIPTARCATVSVPVDYDNPGAGPAQLAVIRIPATGSRIGVLLINPGGPGASAVDSLAAAAPGLADSPIGQHFDLIGVDPRGVGHSTPALRCRTDAEFDAWRKDPMADYSQAGVAHIESLYQQLARQCADRMGAQFLEDAGTATSARDMDLVRQALGETQLSYLGYSYGTELGAAYAGAYPQNVRTMVLDGAVDPTKDPIAEQIDQAASFQLAFNDYVADCVQVEGCPLGNDPAKAVDRYHALVNPLVTTPGRTSDPRGLSYQDAITGTINALYTQRYWKFLTSGLLGLQRGTDAGDLLMLADDYQGRDDTGHYSNLQDAFTSIRCVDNVAPTDPAVWVAADQKIRQVAPFMSYGEFTGFAPRDVCSFWPVPPTSRPHQAVSPGPGKVVVVSTTHDPATPYQAGVELARQLGAALITNDGTQHTVVFTGNDCVDAPVAAFFVDQTAPQPGLRC